MGNILVPNQSDHRWDSVFDLNRPGDRNRRVSTAVGISVCDQIDSRDLRIDRTIGIGSAITIHRIVPSCSGIHIFGSCLVGDIAVAQ